MVTDSTDPRILEAKPKHFLVKRRDGVIFLVAEVERYEDGEADYDDANGLFKESFARNPEHAAPVKKKASDEAQSVQEGQSAALGGALTVHFQSGD